MPQSVAEKVAETREDQIQCFVCKDEVKLADYVEHLNKVHNIKETAFFMENALHRIENQPEAPHEVVEIGEEGGKDTLREEVRSEVDKTLTNLFAPIVQLCEDGGAEDLPGNIALEDGSPSVMDDVLENIFKELKSVLSGRKLIEKCLKLGQSELTKTNANPNSEESSDACEAKDTDEVITQIIEPPKITQKKVQQPTSKTEGGPDILDRDFPNSAKSQVPRSINKAHGDLDRECPNASCSFRTSKQGMRNLEAANHLVNCHQVIIALIEDHCPRHNHNNIHHHYYRQRYDNHRHCRQPIIN